MAVVKGSKPAQLRVVEHRPFRLWCLRLSLAIFLLLSIIGAYGYGVWHALQEQAIAEADLAQARQELESTRAAEEELRQQLANLKLGAQVDRQASEDVRQEVIELKNQLAALQEENSFYRNLMAPSENQEGLNFGVVELSDTDLPREYRYKVVMQQLATNHQLLNGSLTFNIVGRRDGVEEVLPLNAVSEDVDQDSIKLRFKYFQTVQGVLTLPAGFEPERIELVARSTGSNSTTVEKRFGWLVQQI